MTTEYLPDERVSWIAELRPESSLDALAALRLSSALAREHGVPHVLYGRQDGAWTYAIARGVTGPFDRLRVAVDFCGVDGTARSEADFHRALRAVRDWRMGEPAVSIGTTAAAERATQLAELKERLDLNAEVHIHVLSGCAPDEVDRLLVSLGLVRTDGVMYEPDGRDDSYAIDVTPPELHGYFSIPRTPEPLRVLDALAATTQAIAAHFPLAMVDVGRGRESDWTNTRAEVGRVVDELRAEGFEPGDGAALQLF